MVREEEYVRVVEREQAWLILQRPTASPPGVGDAKPHARPVLELTALSPSAKLP
jgi:hypothetical protein